MYSFIGVTLKGSINGFYQRHQMIIAFVQPMLTFVENAVAGGGNVLVLACSIDVKLCILHSYGCVNG